MLTHEAHYYCALVDKVRCLSLSFKLLQFDRIAGGMRPAGLDVNVSPLLPAQNSSRKPSRIGEEACMTRSLRIAEQI
jgi:hypothetical protein